AILTYFCLSHDTRHPPPPTLFPYTTLFRSVWLPGRSAAMPRFGQRALRLIRSARSAAVPVRSDGSVPAHRTAVLRLDRGSVDCRSEEHTSELQSRFDLVCRLLLEKKKF